LLATIRATRLLLIVTRGNMQLRSIATSAAPAAFAARPADAARPAGTAGNAARKLVIAPSVRPLTIADLAGEWTHQGSRFTRCVDRYTGAFVGDDSITMRTIWTITATGTIASNSSGIHNGRIFAESTIGRIRLTGNILDIRLKGGARAKYVVRGWLEGRATTVLKINGPWHGDIPRELLDSSDQGWSCDESWLRAAEPQYPPR
jgi:hypothetical protein